MSDVMISKLEIKLGDRTISVTVEEARALKNLLEDIFGHQPLISPREILIYPYPYPQPYYPPNQPMWEITCKSETQTLCSTLH